MSAFSPLVIALMVVCILTETLRELCFKRVSIDNRSQATHPLLWAGMVLWAIEMLSWTNVLQHVALSIAFPLISLSYATVMLASAWCFNEKIDARRALGAFLITGGVVCIGAAG